MQDVSQMSDAELLAALGRSPQQPRTQQQPRQQQAASMPPQGAGGGNLTAEALFPALVQQESRGRAGAVGPDTRWGNALGRTQMLPATAREMAQRVGVPFDESMLRGTSPEAAAYQDRLGMAYLQEGFERTGNPREALMYYHGGPDRRLWGPKTRAYADEVLARQQNGDFAQVSTSSPQPPADDLGGMSDEALLAALGQQDAPAPTAAQMYNGRPVQISVSDPVQANEAGAYDLSNPTAGMDLSVLGQGDRVALSDGQTRTLRGSPYGDNSRSTDQQVGGFNLREPNATDTAGAYATASTEQIPFADEAATGLSAMLSGRGYSDERQRVLEQRDRMNQTDRGARVAGGLTGFGLGLAAPGGRFIANGPSAAYRASRAAAVGAGYGALYGAGAAEGGVGERAQAGAMGAGLGLASGGLLQGAADRFSRVASSATPSAARVLSREGVDLTPGQMMSGVPVVGNIARGLEEGASSIPVVGAPIAAARERSIETFNRAALNRALAPIGETMPRGTNAGYAAVETAQDALGRAYDEVLPRVRANLDQPLYDEFSAILNRAASEMPEDMTRQLAAVAQNRVFRGIEDAAGEIDGQQFKRIESELGALARNYRTANDPAARSFGQSVEDMRTAVRDMIARQNPAEAQRIGNINRGYANLVRVEDAAGSSASQAAEGVFSPTQLGMAAGRGAARSARGRGGALMQDLASAGRSVLPSRVGDSGTATRGALTGLVAGAGAAINPGVALPTAIGAAAVYSRPVQTLLNTIYRATDRPGATAEALSRLAVLARSDPALVPVYESALLHSQLAAPSQSQEQRPAARGLFGARRPQMAPQ